MTTPWPLRAPGAPLVGFAGTPYPSSSPMFDTLASVGEGISGHATETMQLHYSTVHGDEIRARLGDVVSLVSASGKLGIEPSGVHEPEMQKTGSG